MEITDKSIPYHVSYYAANKERIRANANKWNAKNIEKVREWGRIQAAKNREKARERVKQWRANNLEKARANSKKWAKENPEKANAVNRKWRSENRSKARASSNKWGKENKIHIAAYRRNRRANDPLYAMKSRLRVRLGHALRYNGYKKQSSTQQMLGCSYEKFKKHIEKQFTDGMNWDNRSEWNLDHIIPLSCATTIEGIEKLSHYTNIRPLWTKDNKTKSDNLVLI